MLVIAFVVWWAVVGAFVNEKGLIEQNAWIQIAKPGPFSSGSNTFPIPRHVHKIWRRRIHFLFLFFLQLFNYYQLLPTKLLYPWNKFYPIKIEPSFQKISDGPPCFEYSVQRSPYNFYANIFSTLEHNILFFLGIKSFSLKFLLELHIGFNKVSKLSMKLIVH